jgi:beta-lactamase superfamily II metal-dependent hydrolase
MEEAQTAINIEDFSQKIFNVTSFPANCGDSFWVTYGTISDQHHILIDGGTATVADVIEDHIATLPVGSVLELLVVTHYDSDHLEGIRKLLSNASLIMPIKEIWYNDYARLQQTVELESFGAKMAEMLSTAINKHKIPWNTSFQGKAVVVPDIGDTLPVFAFPGKMEITLISPYQKQLNVLKNAWEDELALTDFEAGYGAKILDEKTADLERFGEEVPDFEALGKTTFNPDKAPGNGSSIAFIASFSNKKVLFAGDAFSEVLIESLKRIQAEKLPIDLLKVSHHGGARNTDPNLIKQISCKHYLFSTSGEIRPTEQTMAYILKSSIYPTFYFNYESQKTRSWESGVLKALFEYSTEYATDQSLQIDVLKLKN